ncbi:unnamed protein product [Ceratitis capitata]|uniref:(Mediterranean fruit fly) hypothetical protein n=1 Tax=Ceratitis capitata TaxID=7213 RepID=A0A811VJG0_CERCA|nr:unnamed protein product [Ceratitis capitata]
MFISKIRQGVRATLGDVTLTVAPTRQRIIQCARLNEAYKKVAAKSRRTMEREREPNTVSYAFRKVVYTLMYT